MSSTERAWRPTGYPVGTAMALGRGSSHVRPVAAQRDLEPVTFGEIHAGAVLLLDLSAFLVIDALEEEKREDKLLIVPGVDQPAQQRRGAPEIGFEFGLGDGTGCAQEQSPEDLLFASSARDTSTA